MDICAGIVLFNPEIERLKDNINHIEKQVKLLIVVDNGSKNINDIRSLLNNYNNIQLIENKKNLGIAKALNKILYIAGIYSFDWVLTLDQDSVADKNLIQQYAYFINNTKEKNIGCLTCNISDRNFSIDLPCYGFKEIDYCITSGSLMHLKNTLSVGGFDEKMFIDKVDTDICINLIKHGYKIIRIDFNGLLHEIGHAKQINLGFRKWELYNHGSFRRYYMCRNAIYLLKKYHDFYTFKIFAKEIFQFILIILFEDNKIEKSMKGIKGFFDGLIS